MMDTATTTNHDEIIECISSFYTFLTTHGYLVPSAIKTPPSSGWPEEYRSVWQKMGKAEAVVDLLSHLPYIDADHWEWFHDTKPINYLNPLNLRRIGENWEGKRSLFEPTEKSIGVPAHIFSLTNGKLYGTWLLLDTQAGTITELSILGGRCLSEDQVANGETWRLYPTRPIKEFFAACQERMDGGAVAKEQARRFVRC